MSAKPHCQKPCTCARIEDLLVRYARQHRAIAVDFRKEVRGLPKVDKGRHYIHPYPAKLLAEIPLFFLANDIFSKRGETVLDPFCGSGTVLLEASRIGRECIGVDSNPLARLITRVKLNTVRETDVRHALAVVCDSFPTVASMPYPDVVNIDYWFHPHVKKQLGKLSAALERIPASNVKKYLQVCLSCCVKDVSNADPRLSVPVALRANQYPPKHPLRHKTIKRLAKLRRINVLKRFCEIANNNLSFVSRPPEKRPGNRLLLLSDAKRITQTLRQASVELIITSPPYLGAQKYVRASSLNLGWLRMSPRDGLRKLEGMTIGREHFRKNSHAKLPPTGIPEADRRITTVAKQNPVRAKIANTYINEMRTVIEEIQTVLRPGGHMILVVGNNHLCGKPFPTERYLREIAESEGFVTRLRLVDTIKSRGLMTKRNKTANVISREWILVLQKPEHPRRSR